MGAPDLRAPVEAMIWNSDYFARVKVRLGDLDDRFRDRLVAEVHRGVTGRGKAAIDRDGLLKVVFGLTDDERGSTAVLEEYVNALVAYLRVDDAAVQLARIDRVELSPADTERLAKAIRSLGLRALQNNE